MNDTITTVNVTNKSNEKLWAEMSYGGTAFRAGDKRSTLVNKKVLKEQPMKFKVGDQGEYNPVFLDTSKNFIEVIFDGETLTFDVPVTIAGKMTLKVAAPNVTGSDISDLIIAKPGSVIDGGKSYDEIILSGKPSDYSFVTKNDTLVSGNSYVFKDAELFRFLGEPNNVYAYSHSLKVIVPIIGDGKLISTGGRLETEVIIKPTPVQPIIPTQNTTPVPPVSQVTPPKPVANNSGKTGGLVLKK